MSDEFQESIDKSPAGGEHVHSGHLPMSVLILWENVASASAAKQICRELEEAGQLPAWRESMWKFDLLRLRGFRETAACEAADADWIIVAFENSSTPPAELRQWLDSWQNQASGKPQSLIALCVPSSTSNDQNSVVDDLRAFAGLLGCKFHESRGGAIKNSTPINSGDQTESV